MIGTFLFYGEAMIKPRMVPVLFAAGLLMFLTGCADDAASDPDASGTPTAIATSPSATPDDEPSSTASASPTTAPADGPPALSTLTASPAGVGTLVMNQPIAAEPSGTAMAVWDPTYCVVDGRAEGDPGAGAWRSAYPTTTVPWTPEPVDALTVYTQNREQTTPLSSVIVWSPELATATGIHPGSTQAELESAYPTFESVTDKGRTDLYVVKDPDGIPGELWFEVANASFSEDAALNEAVEGTVLWFSVNASGDFEPYSLTETDSGGGLCQP